MPKGFGLEAMGPERAETSAKGYCRETGRKRKPHPVGTEPREGEGFGRNSFGVPLISGSLPVLNGGVETAEIPAAKTLFVSRNPTSPRA